MMHCQLQKTYQTGSRTFYLNVKANFKLNSINVLFGASGSGKTSLLRLLSGLDKADEGAIKIEHNYWLQTQTKINLPIAQRGIAYVFQENNLFPNMTVLKNLQFAQKNTSKQFINELTEVFELKHLLLAKSKDLSGGQKQRVALAMAIVQKPAYLFLDEPFAALDAILSNKLQRYLMSIQEKHKFTVIMITHQLKEVLKMATHVCVLKNGQVVKQGSPHVLVSKNSSNTLTANVLNIGIDDVTVLIGTEQITIFKHQITTTYFKKGDEIKVRL